MDRNDMLLLSDDELELVSGGATKAYLAAVDLMNGKYGTGEACRQSLTDAGFDIKTEAARLQEFYLKAARE